MLHCNIQAPTKPAGARVPWGGTLQPNPVQRMGGPFAGRPAGSKHRYQSPAVFVPGHPTCVHVPRPAASPCTPTTQPKVLSYIPQMKGKGHGRSQSSIQ